MAEPGGELREGSCGAELPHQPGQVGKSARLESAQLSLEVCPPQFNRIEVGAVGGQVRKPPIQPMVSAIKCLFR